jgi:hypothetical protein
MAKKPIDGLKSVDQLMRKTAQTLVRDFQDNLNDPCFCSGFQSILKTGTVAEIREAVPAPDQQMDVATFKATYQLQSVLKRYRFSNDTYSDQELEEKAINSFLETQDRIAAVDLDGLPCIWQVVLDRAASYVARVLGPYDGEKHRSLCRFGKKASVGVPARSACEAARWEIPLTGSREQISWFDAEMRDIDCVQDYWRHQSDSDPSRSIYQETSSLTLALVPKTFKSLRAIMPNTTIGSYMSYGLGEMIRLRLKRKGYNIKTLQQRHRVLAQQASLDGNLTTADLSSASDSITVALVHRLFPPDWFDILSQSRIGTVMLPNGHQVESKTFCTMGIGYTFPLQTLVFLSLLKAIQSFMVDKAGCQTISVYGDDMIYPSTMHPFVLQVFEKVGFVINVDKTFHDGHFRESCGGDYFRGVDVRPFQPQNGSASVGPKTYEAILYKFVNTLLARWSEYEIGETLKYLTSEIEVVTGKAKLVPVDYPDDSGIKCSTMPNPWFFLRKAALSMPKSVGHGLYRFSFLRLVPDEREETRHGPYLWAALRGLSLHDAPYWVPSVGGNCSSSPVARRIDELTGTQLSTPALITREVHPIKTFRSKLTGRRLRRTSTFVTVSHTGRYKRQSGTSGFEDRR